jgi:hypothetical protein
MASNNSADFTSLFNIQTQYLGNLAALTDSNNGPTGTYYTNLQNKLNDLYNVYGNAMPASSAALDNQSQMYNIIQQEQQRINQKKTGVDNAYATQQRLIQLNESYREKNMKYINILIIIIIAIVIYLALLMTSRHLPFIPPFLINLSMALLFSITLIIVVVIFVRINKRDNMNFQKLLFVPPPSGNVYGNVYGNTISFDISQTCMGNICCGDGTTWDPMQGICTITPTSGFTLMNGLYGNNCGKCNNQDIVYIPYTPYEFDSYAKI